MNDGRQMRPEATDVGPGPLSETDTMGDIASSQRARLFSALAQSCETRGFGAATISDIVARAGMGRATFYKHFESKEACLTTAVTMMVEELRKAIEGAAATTDDWPISVRRALTGIVEVLVAKPAFAQLAFLESRAVDLNLLEPYRTALLALLESGPAGTGPVRGNSRVNAEYVYGQVQAMFIGAGFAGEVRQLRGQLPTLLYVGLLPSLGPAEAYRHMARAAEQQQ